MNPCTLCYMDLVMESFCGGNKLLGLKVKHYFSTVNQLIPILFILNTKFKKPVF